MNNIESWRELLRRGYFANHEYYQGKLRTAGADVAQISKYRKILPTDAFLIIGCGYGRESALISPHVRKIYAIDLPEAVAEARTFLESKNVRNVEFIEYERETWIEKIPEPIDFAYSFNVFQHLALDIAKDYLNHVCERLTGSGLIQFCNCLDGGELDVDDHRIYEPQINWTIPLIRAVFVQSGYKIAEIETTRIRQNKHDFEWYWIYFRANKKGG